MQSIIYGSHWSVLNFLLALMEAVVGHSQGLRVDKNCPRKHLNTFCLKLFQACDVFLIYCVNAARLSERFVHKIKIISRVVIERLLDMKLSCRGIRGLVGLLVQKELMELRLVHFFPLCACLAIGQIFCCQHIFFFKKILF